MYSESDIRIARKKTNAMLLYGLVLVGALMAAMCVGLALRVKWLVIVSPILGAWVGYTWWSLKFLPWFRYNRFLLSMQQGRHRETSCYFVDVSDAVRLVDGVQIHDFNASLDEAGEDVRLFYWDDDKPLPEMRKGQRLRLTSYGNFIIGFECL